MVHIGLAKKRQKLVFEVFSDFYLEVHSCPALASPALGVAFRLKPPIYTALALLTRLKIAEPSGRTFFFCFAILAVLAPVS
jgi:hypothetical protein